jgi:hypothetical protein
MRGTSREAFTKRCRIIEAILLATLKRFINRLVVCGF